MKNIGLRMETLRKNMHLTPEAVSSYLEIPVEDLLDMEKGKKNITLSILNQLCALFRCSESYILCRSDEFDPAAFVFRGSSIETDDLQGIAGMNRIYLNMKYLTKKMDD